MAGAQFGTGLSGSVIGGLYRNPGSSTAAVPMPNAYPENSSGVTQAAFGQGAMADGGTTAGLHCTWLGAAAFAALVFIWWGLPR